MFTLAPPHVLSLKPYIPGRLLENNHRITKWARLASNENCLGPSPLAMEAAVRSLKHCHLYPNAKRFLMTTKLVEHLNEYAIKAEHIALGNGASELIVNLVRGMLSFDEAILFGSPTFVMYNLAAIAHNRMSIAIPVKEDMSFDLLAMKKRILDRSKNAVKMVFLANPNNPTGNYINKKELEDFIRDIPKDVVLVIDEAYCEYVVDKDYPNSLSYALSRPRTIVLRTFSKVYGLAGLRLGYAIGDPEIIDVLSRISDPFNINSVAQDAAIAALDDKEHVVKSIKHNLSMRPKHMKGLAQRGFLVHDSVGNFIMAQKPDFTPSVSELCNKLLAKGVLVRPLENFGLKDWIRVSVGTEEEMDLLFMALDTALSQL